MIFTLIGMPGSGKTSFGKTAASRLHLKLVDGDRLIEKKTGRKLQDIINEDGNEAFKKIEEEVLLSFNSDEDVVFSPGGSVVYYDSVMQHLRSLGKVIFLYASLPVIKERIGDFSRRGIVLAPGQTIDALFEERSKLYKKYADYTVNVDGDAYPYYQSKVIAVIRRELRDKKRKENENAKETLS